MNTRSHTPQMLEALRRCMSLPPSARLVPDHESEALARKVAAQREWLRERTFWKAVHPDEGLSMFLKAQAR